jgi:peptide-methionine (R)-S-oxide reductase
MKIMRKISTGLFALFFAVSCTAQSTNKNPKKDLNVKVKKTEEEWKNELTDEQFFVLRQAGTERPGTGKYNLHFEKGQYKCAGCDAVLFGSDDKFESHCGWPSFDNAADNDAIIEREDRSHGMVRTEVLCANCGGHLGHLFNDGPTETGMRYCINSAALDFDKKSSDKTED